MTVLDANMILRYLLNDNAAMAETAERYIEAGNVSVTIEVMAEVVYVLKGVYFMERDLIAQTLRTFLSLVACRDWDVLECALNTYSERSLDFVDCILYGYHCVRGAEIATFDKKLLRLVSD